MATTFPRTFNPRSASPLRMPGPLFSKSQSGRVQTRSTQRVGWTWEEDFLFKWDATGRQFIAAVTYYWRQATIMEVSHVAYTLLGAGGGTPLVAGADQTGDNVTTDGWPTSTTVLRGGDLITFAGITQVYLVRFDVTSDVGGNATISITPRIFEGGEPGDNAAITITDSVVITAKIADFQLPEHGPDYWVAPRILWTETP